MATKSILKEVKIKNKVQANKFVDALTSSENNKNKRNVTDDKVYARTYKHVKKKVDIRTTFSSIFNK